MLSIPIHIIGTRRLGLLTPLLAYIVGILLFCQLFITVFVKPANRVLAPVRVPVLEELAQGQGQGQNQFQGSSSRVHRRSVGTSKTGPEQDESTRRSHSTQVRARHQDLDPESNNAAEVLDNDGAAFFPWPEDVQCRNWAVRFAKKYSFKPRALVSFPGSGNSWLRYLIDSSTGIFTGSLFNDQELFDAGLHGEMKWPNDGSTIVQKTHHDAINSLDLARMSPGLSNQRKIQAFVKVSELVFGYRGILLIRNPYEALLSYWNFIRTKHHKGHARPADFSTMQWRKFVELGSQKWANLIDSWLENSMDLHIVQYEELLRNPERELKRILNYLDQPLNPERLRCVLQHLEGPFHRHSDSDLQTTNMTNIEKLSYDDYTPPLDLIVQQHIDDINILFRRKKIHVRLDYTLPEYISSFYT